MDDKVEFDEQFRPPVSNDNGALVARVAEDIDSSALESGVGEWTETMLRDLLSQTLNQRIQHLLDRGLEPETPAVDLVAAREARVRTSTHLLYDAVTDGDSEAMIDVMCDLTPAELRDVVSGAECSLRLRGLTSVDVRVDDFDRIVLFDNEINNGVALAPSGSYQRVSQFYDGSYRYGIEFVLDESSKESVDCLFSKIKMQIAC